MKNRFIRLARAVHLAFMVLLLSFLSGNALAQKVSFKGNNVPIKSVLKSVEKSTGFTFVYSNSVLNDRTPVSVDLKDASLNDALGRIFGPLGIAYKVSGNHIMLQSADGKPSDGDIVKDKGHGTSQSKNGKREVKGKVVDQNGKTLPGVSIAVLGTTIGTTTDGDGNFTITIPENVDQINLSYVGYTSKAVKLTSASLSMIKLEPANVDIDEVVVVAYGTSSKKAMTGAVTSVNSDMIVRNKSNNVLNSLQGMVAGLQMNSKSRGGGVSTQEIIIRGNSSINSSNEPLYIIDGVPSSSMGSLSPDDIESISVLKDASAVSLYGARATNGVILITTKQGSYTDQRPVVSYSGQFGVSTRTGKDYKIVGPKDFYELSWEAMRNGAIDNPTLLTANGKNYASAADYASNELVGKLGYNAYSSATPVGLDGRLDPNAKLLWWENFDDELLKTGIRNEHNLSISGGTKRMKNYVSIGYLNQKGLDPGDDGFDRLTARMNFTYDVSKYVTIGANLGYAASKNESESVNGQGSFASYSRSIPGLYPIHKRNPQGQLVYDVDGNKILDWGDGPMDVLNSRFPGITEEGKGINPLGTLDLDNTISKSNNVSMNVFANIKLMDGLSLRTTYASNYDNGSNKSYTNCSIGSSKGIGRLNSSSSDSKRWTFNSILTYEKTFNEKHNVKALLGAELNESNQSVNQAVSTGFLFDGMEEHSNASSWERPTVPSASSKSSLEGFFSKLEYSYSNRYFVSGSFRRDGSSNFHPDTRWGNFWSVGGSWIFTNEDFLSNQSILSYGKLRVSYGTTGNIGSNDFRSYYRGGYTFLGKPGFSYASLANKDLKWEVNKQLNIGLETSFLNGRIRTIVEFYNRVTDDLFYNVPLSPSIGFNKVLRNIGSLRNRGIEVTLNTDNIKTNDFRWSTSFNIASNKNKILSLNQDEFVQGNRIFKVGMSTNEFFIPEYAGVNPDNGKPMWYIDEVDVNTGEKTGNRVKTENYGSLSNTSVKLNDGSVVKFSNLGKYKMGSYSPTISGGLNNTFNYKGFDFSVLLTYSLGSKVLMGDYAGLMNIMPNVGSGFYQFHQDMLDRWQKPGDITDVPRLSTTVGTNYYSKTSSNLLRSGDYLKLKNIVFGYTIPEKVYSKLKISSARVYFQADNIRYWSAEQGFDPEQVSSGSVDSQYPAISTYSFGVKITF